MHRFQRRAGHLPCSAGVPARSGPGMNRIPGHQGGRAVTLQIKTAATK